MGHTTIIKKLVVVFLVLSFIFLGTHAVLADDDEDLEAMQRALNKEIMDRPFNAGDKAAVDKYVEDALKKNKIPKEYSGKDWRQGYTCNNLMGSLFQYRNCLHYYRYYGRYYPY